MSNNEKVKILKDFLGGYNRTGQEYLFTCPKCKHHKRKLSVNLDKNVFKCWICEFKGNNINRLVRKYADFNLKAKWRELTGQVEIQQFCVFFSAIFLMHLCSHSGQASRRPLGTYLGYLILFHTCTNQLLVVQRKILRLNVLR